MTLDVPPAEDEQDRKQKERSVEDLLRELLVGEAKVKVDPVGGEIDRGSEKSS